MSAFGDALTAASRGSEWRCLFWLADYVQAVRGVDPAVGWRDTEANERAALRAMLRAGRGTPGDSPVERVMRAIAARDRWGRLECPSGACVGVHRISDGITCPSIFDGSLRWLLVASDGAQLTRTPPIILWNIDAQDTGSHSDSAADVDGMDVRGSR